MMYRKKKKDVMKASQIGPHGRLKLGFKGLLGTSCTAVWQVRVKTRDSLVLRNQPNVIYVQR